jgi:hypothetical protein
VTPVLAGHLKACLAADLSSSCRHRADPVLVDRGEWVVEIDRPKRSRGRHWAKSDAQDAIRAGIVQAGADARRQLKALIVVIRWSTGPPCRRFI